MTAIVEDVQSQGIDSALVILYDLELSTTNSAYFFPAGLDDDLTEIQFRDSGGTERTYVALPMQAEGLDISSDGAYNRPELTVANIESVFSDELDGLSFEQLIGKRITRRTTLKKYLYGETGDSNPPTEFPKITYVIDRIKSKSAVSVTFELAAPFDLAGIQLPRRTIIGGACPWKYTGASSRKYDTDNLIWTDAAEIEKEGGCDWRRDSIINIEGTDYTLYMTGNDEYILPSSTTFTATSGLSSFSANNYYKDTATVRRIKSDGTFEDVTIDQYWQCLFSTSSGPSSSSSSWKPVRLYYTYSASTQYFGYQDKRHNQYVVKDNRLWQVKRLTQDANSHGTVTEGAHWTAGDVCGKKLTSCAKRFQAKVNSASQGGFDAKRDSRVALPFGGFPGVVQRR